MSRRTGSGGGHIELFALVLLMLVHQDVSINVIASLGINQISPSKYPFLVSVNDMCSGAIISPHHVLTSAHCVENGPSAGGKSFIRVGAFDLTDPDSGRKFYVKQTMIHEWYDRLTGKWRWDLAMLVIKEKIAGHGDIIDLPNSSDDSIRVGRHLKVIGWEQSDKGCTPVPHEYDLPVVSPKKCEIYQDECNVCVAMGPGPRPCDGNCSGILFKNSYYYGPTLLGISTYNPTLLCNPNHNPRLFTQVSCKEHLDWIKSKRLESFCASSGNSTDRDINNCTPIGIENILS